MEPVEIRHPGITGTATVPASAVTHWQSAGWEVVHPSTAADVSDQLVENEPSE